MQTFGGAEVWPRDAYNQDLEVPQEQGWVEVPDRTVTVIHRISGSAFFYSEVSLCIIHWTTFSFSFKRSISNRPIFRWCHPWPSSKEGLDIDF